MQVISLIDSRSEIKKVISDKPLINQRIVIMAAGNSKRWQNHLGIPKQLAPVQGEPVIKRTIRQLKERKYNDIYVTVREYGQFGNLDVIEYIKPVNEYPIDRIYGAKDLVPCLFLFGDVYYTDDALDAILADDHDWWFYGRRFPGIFKGNREIYAVKADDYLIKKAAELRELHIQGKVKNSLAQFLHLYMLSFPINPKTKNFITKPEEIGNHFTDIEDLTTDFDTAYDYNYLLRLLKNISRSKILTKKSKRVTKTIRQQKRAIEAYYSFNRLIDDVTQRFLVQIPADVDLVVGIPRDGLFVAYLISIYRNIPMTDLTSFCEERIYEPGIKHRRDWNIRKVLVVDDICATGTAMKEARNKLARLSHKYAILTGAIYVSNPKLKQQTGLIDIYAVELPKPRHYEWTHCDAVHLLATMMDIDGILCAECSVDDTNDEEYAKWMKTVPLKLRPQNIGTLITWRPEKYRDITEDWLQNKGITYDVLVMADRDQWTDPATFKAHHYLQSGARFFIDSSAKVAERVHQLTGKPTLGFDANEVFGIEN